MRFCQQCSRLDPLEAFEGQRRSCREGLLRIGERRRERIQGAKVGQPSTPVRNNLFGGFSFGSVRCTVN